MQWGRGYGFRGESPPWPYVGWGRGGLPRCEWRPGWDRGRRLGRRFYADPYAPAPTRDEEMAGLRQEADALRRELEAVESRLRELSPQ